MQNEPAVAQNELALNDDALREMAAMAAETNKGMGASQSLPVLKIQYDPDAVTPRGSWVVGQKKDENGVVIDEGKVVVGFIPVQIRDRFSFYNEKNTADNCQSIMYDGGDYAFDRTTLRGLKHGYVCGKTCPKRAEDATPRCGGQKVVFGIALCQDGSKVSCVSYIKGASYMPLMDYLDSVSHHNGHAIPTYAFVAMLGSRKEKNKGTTFFVAEFAKGDFVGMDNLKKFYLLAKNEIEPLISRMNAASQAPRDGKPGVAAPAAAPAAAAPASVRPAPAQRVEKDITPTVVGGLGDVAAGFSAASVLDGMDDVPFNVESVAQPVDVTAAANAVDAEIAAVNAAGSPDSWTELVDSLLRQP